MGSLILGSFLHISIHALLAESDPTQYARHNAHMYFYPRSPCGERRGAYRAAPQSRRHFYPRSPCGERPEQCPFDFWTDKISIHALLAESDAPGLYLHQRCGISIHALLAESDLSGLVCAPLAQDFYPRSPCGERRAACARRRGCGHFYPRSPCGERRGVPSYTSAGCISIHALLAESDTSLFPARMSCA